ncbi:MAG: hypothetical protein RLZZ565_217 [Planctomycetota bacterium]
MKVERTIRGEAIHLAFEGRIDSAWAESASKELESAIRSGKARIDLDFDRVSFISSVGIGILVQSFTRFRAVGGVLAIVTASEPVRGMLRVAKLESMLMPAAKPSAVSEDASPIGSGWSGRVRRLGAAPPSGASIRLVREGLVAASPDLLAIGHFALASDATEARGHHGEGLAAGGTVVVQPAEAPRPDCLASSEAGTVSFVARESIVVEGAPALHGEFEEGHGEAVTVSSLASAMVSRANGAIAFLAMGECAGAFGAWARTSPDGWREPPRSMSPDAMRRALRFAGEPMHAGESLVVVGVAAPPGSAGEVPPEVSETLVEAGDVLLHAHAAVASYRPVPATTADVRAAGSLLAEQPIRLVLHAMRGGSGEETAFVRGIAFVWPLATGGSA